LDGLFGTVTRRYPVACSRIRQCNFDSISLLDLFETENTNLKNTIIGHKYLAQPRIRFLFEEYLQTKKARKN